MESYDGESRPMVVTQRIAQGETFDMSWSPGRRGQHGISTADFLSFLRVAAQLHGVVTASDVC